MNSVLYRQIAGALKTTITAHGVINKNFVPSAAKRVLGHLNKFKNSFPDDLLKEQLLLLMAREHRRLVLLRAKTDRATDPHRKSHIAGKVSEKRRQLIQLDLLLKRTSPDAKVITEKQGD